VALGGFHHDRRPDDVDARPEHRVRANHGHLKRGQVEDVGDLIFDHGGFKRVLIGDIAVDEMDLG